MTSLDRSRLALVAALGVDNFGTGLFLPLALVFAHRVVGLGVDTAGSVVAAATLLGLVVPPVAGRLTHRFGPRWVVVLSQVVQGAGVATYLVAGGAAGVFVATGLLAAGTQLFYCSVFVLVADVSTNERKERPFALVAMVRAASFGLGNLTAALGLSLGGTASLRWLVAADAVSFVVAALLLGRYVVADPVAHGVPPVGPLTALRDRRYLTLLAVVCLLTLGVDVALLGVSVYVIDVLHGPAWLPGALIACSTVLGSVLGVRVVDAMRGMRRTRSLQLGACFFALWAVLMGMLAAVPDAWLVPVAFGCWLVVVAGTKTFYPVAGALSEALPPREVRAGYLATYQYAFTTAQVLAPGVVGLFAVAAWLPWAVVASAALGGAALVRRLARSVPAEVDLPSQVPEAATA